MIEKGTLVEIVFKDEREKTIVNKAIFRVDKGNKIVVKNIETELEVIIPWDRVVIVKELKS